MPTLPSYIAKNQKELFSAAGETIQSLIKGGEVKAVASELAKKHSIPEEKNTRLSNVISFILIEAILPEDVVQALEDIVEVSGEVAVAIAEDLEDGILKKAGITLIEKDEETLDEEEIKKLAWQGEKTKEELRDSILETTKRESAITKSPVAPPIKPPVAKKDAPKSGSRSQLLEQLQVLGTIPGEEEIEERLKRIQAQISSIKKQEEDNSLKSNIALKSFMFGEKGKEAVEPALKMATYSVPPKDYNVDPYREIGTDDF